MKSFLGSLLADMNTFYFGHTAPPASVPLFSGAILTLPRKAALEAAKHYEKEHK